MKKRAVFLSVPIKFTLRVILLGIISTTLLCLQAKAEADDPQRVTLNLKEVSLSKLFEEIQKQTTYKFFYNDTQEQEMKKISVTANNETVESVLDKVFRGTKYTYQISGNQIVVKQSKEHINVLKKTEVMGRVTTKDNKTLPGVTVLLKGTTIGTSTNHNGEYNLTVPQSSDFTLIFSFIGMKTVEVIYTGKDTINITMEEESENLEDVVVTGYMSINKGNYVGAVTSVNVNDIKIAGE